MFVGLVITVMNWTVSLHLDLYKVHMRVHTLATRARDARASQENVLKPLMCLFVSFFGGGWVGVFTQIWVKLSPSHMRIKNCTLTWGFYYILRTLIVDVSKKWRRWDHWQTWPLRKNESERKMSKQKFYSLVPVKIWHSFQKTLSFIFENKVNKRLRQNT